MKSGRIVRSAVVSSLRAPLHAPFRIASGQHDELKNVVLRLELENGAVGWGEAAIASHITGETVRKTISNLTRAAEQLVGVDITNYTVLLFELRPQLKGNHAALAAIEMAVLDAYARSYKLPLWRMFGEKAVSFSTDITIVLGSVSEAEAAVQAFAARGFASYKIKVGGDFDEDIKRVAAVVRLAPGSAIILDGNQGFAATEALKFLKALRKQNIEPVLFEQPVPKDDIAGLARLTEEGGCLICADESVSSVTDLMRLVRENAATAVNVKFMKSGILEALEIAHMAQIKGLRLMIGAMMESALAITAAGHFAAGMDCFDFIDLDTTFFIKGKAAASPYLDSRGRFDVADAGPGIGVTAAAK